MLHSSAVRRVVAATTPQLPSATTASRVAAGYTLPLRPNGLQQRRYSSSSKPSSPDDGSRDLAGARPSVPASGSSNKTTGEKRKRKPKEAARPQLPSVPGTSHIKDEALALSTFFALHRPISVTQHMPKTVTEDAFAKIFNTSTRKYKPSEVLSTLSQTVENLEDPLSNKHITNQKTKQQQAQEVLDELEDRTAKLSLRQSDGTEIPFELDFVQYPPYATPPAPEPMTETEMTAAGEGTAAANAADTEPRTRVYKALVTIEETVYADGQSKVVAHSPELIEENNYDDSVQPRTFLERMARRQLKFDQARQQQDRTMQAISVRRIRKLRMKKKKYKKLRKNTRNERRKLDRL
ncbi:hypothetical protein QBC35DRAFT_481069 [Podospora australis]|uniref:Small ribosomal subunit protein mS38 n=1 Tax=Podospora australis TaxID=1536484 RepID=A0AAN6X435_9PEZI|nr:hypothetical protein QBC35DRAFT_481069 [Podospora australis]